GRERLRVEPDGLEPEPLGLRRAADRDEQLLRRDVRTGAERDGHVAAGRALHARRLLARADVDALLRQRLTDLLAGEDLLLAEQPVLALDQRDPRAERAVRLAHLHADDAAAHDDQARRD